MYHAVYKLSYSIRIIFYNVIFIFFQDVEHSRAYIDQLYSNDPQKCFQAVRYEMHCKFLLLMFLSLILDVSFMNFSLKKLDYDLSTGFKYSQTIYMNIFSC